SPLHRRMTTSREITTHARKAIIPDADDGLSAFPGGGPIMSARPKPETQVDESPAPQPVRGARILCEALLREGVDTIFGYPGGAVLHIYDELYNMRDQLRHVL